MLTGRAGVIAAWLAAAVMVVGLGSPGPAAAPAGLVKTPKLSAVWCSGPRQCLAVGQDGSDIRPISAVWNGKSWRYITTPAKGGDLLALGCSGWTQCMAVGAGQGVIDEWNGASWKSLPATSAMLDSVACAEPRRCVAVGMTSYASRRPGALAWNGTVWSAVRVPRPAGAVASQLTSVACTRPADCLAVGSYNVPLHEPLPMAMRWNGTSWRLVAAPLAVAAGVSCESQSRCIAVGGGSSFIWNGDSWRTVAVPGVDDQLASVSCAGSSCVAVGRSSAFAWNGTKWSTLPRTGIGNAALWCTGPAACMDVGSSSPPTVGVSASSLNGRRWTPLRLSRIEGLSGVSCTGPGNCVAVGDTNNPAFASTALAERLSGAAWRVIGGPARPAGNPVIGVQQISCTSTRFCMTLRAGVSHPGARRWNGSRWIATNLPAGRSSVQGLSCGSARGCVAVTGQTAWIWNGASWRATNPGISGQTVDLQSVSCASATMCMAFGFHLSSTCEINCTVSLLAERWNGSGWSTSDDVVFGQDDESFSHISCPSVTFCMEVTTRSGVMTWNGHTWRKRAVSFPSFDQTDLSCGGTSSCVVIGDYVGNAGRFAYLAEVWNGTSWRATHPIGSGGLLNAVSCSRPHRCVAVGATADDLTMAQSWDGAAWKLLRTINP